MQQRFQMIETDIEDLVLIAPKPIEDERGWFMRVFDAQQFASIGVDAAALPQENQSRSRRGTIRGLHTRAELREAKLIRVPHGRIYDVAVDLRPWSATFGQWRGFVLDDTESVQLRVPAGFAHGFQALSETADVCYRVDADYDPELDVAIAWDDPELAIDWPLADPLLSPRDRAAPRLAEVRPNLPLWFGAAATR